MPLHHQAHGQAIRAVSFAAKIRPQMQVVDVLKQFEVRSVAQERAQKLRLEGPLDAASLLLCLPLVAGVADVAARAVLRGGCL